MNILRTPLSTIIKTSINNNTLTTIDNVPLSEEQEEKYIFFSYLITALGDEYFGLSEEELTTITNGIIERNDPENEGLDTINPLTDGESGSIILKRRAKAIPYITLITQHFKGQSEKVLPPSTRVKEMDWLFFHEGLPIVKHYREVKKGIYTSRIGEKALSKLADTKTKVSPGDVATLKLLLEKANDSLERFNKHNSGKIMIYKQPSYLQDLDKDSRAQALKDRQVITGFLHETFDEYGELTPGHYKEE